MIVTATGVIPRSLLTTVLKWLWGKAARGFERILYGLWGKGTPRKHA